MNYKVKLKYRNNKTVKERKKKHTREKIKEH